MPVAQNRQNVGFFCLFVSSFGVLGEPSFLYAFLLGEQFADAPKCGSPENTQERGEIDVFHEKGSPKAAETDEQIEDPGTGSPVILCLDNDGMPDANGEKRHHGDNDTCEIHIALILLQSYEKRL